MEYIIIAVVIGAVGYFAYTESQKTPVAPVVKSTPKAKPTPKVAKISRPVLSKLTKAQLAEKGKQLGVDVDTKQLKKDIVNEVFKAQ
jgi:hypothetical protein